MHLELIHYAYKSHILNSTIDHKFLTHLLVIIVSVDVHPFFIMQWVIATHGFNKVSLVGARQQFCSSFIIFIPIVQLHHFVPTWTHPMILHMYYIQCSQDVYWYMKMELTIPRVVN